MYVSCASPGRDRRHSGERVRQKRRAGPTARASATTKAKGKSNGIYASGRRCRLGGRNIPFMAVRNAKLDCLYFTCNRCGREWVNVHDDELGRAVFTPIPERCPSCRSREWNGPKRPSRNHAIKLPSPRPRGRPGCAACWTTSRSPALNGEQLTWAALNLRLYTATGSDSSATVRDECRPLIHQLSASRECLYW